MALTLAFINKLPALGNIFFSQIETGVVRMILHKEKRGWRVEKTISLLKRLLVVIETHIQSTTGETH
jgi:hypothetical protein